MGPKEQLAHTAIDPSSGKTQLLDPVVISGSCHSAAQPTLFMTSHWSFALSHPGVIDPSVCSLPSPWNLSPVDKELSVGLLGDQSGSGRAT